MEVEWDVSNDEFIFTFSAIIEIAYSAAVYVQSSKNDNIVTNLLTAKSKIVQNRKLTVPKLELMSCLLLLGLIVSVRKTLSVQVKVSNVVSWSDSKVAL